MAIAANYPNAPMPLAQFIAVQPGDPDYMAGWAKAALVAQAITPAAVVPMTNQDFWKAVVANYLTASQNGWVNDSNTGYNDCLEMAGQYEWAFDPKSPHNVAS